MTVEFSIMVGLIPRFAGSANGFAPYAVYVVGEGNLTSQGLVGEEITTRLTIQVGEEIVYQMKEVWWH